MMSGRTAAIAAALLCLSAQASHAHEVKHGKLTIAHPFVALDPACKSGPLRGYVMLIVNEGGQADRLLGAELTPGGKGRLVPLTAPAAGAAPPGLDIPAHGRAAVMAPALALEFPAPRVAAGEGGMVRGALKFERAGTVPVQFMVEATHRSADGKSPPCTAAPAAHKH